MELHHTPYENMLADVMANGVATEDRTGVGTHSVFGRQMRFDLEKEFPAITTKKLYWKGVVGELLWFLSGDTNISYLTDNNIHIWDEWADDNGDLGPVYGHQWRSWQSCDGSTVDQISAVVDSLSTNPHSRRHIVSAWNVDQLEDMALPPCHLFFQFHVSDGKLSCQLYQRSADLFLGVPFNIASYSLLTHMIAKEVGLGVGEFIWTGGDVHIYNNHREQVEKQLCRVSRPLPTLAPLPEGKSLFTYDIDDIQLIGYNPHGAIAADVAV